MRLSFILSSLYLSGGVRVVVEYANRLAGRGHTINLVTPQGSLDPDIQREVQAGVHIYQSRVSLSASASITHNLRLAWSLSRAVPASDIVFSTHTPTIPSAWLAARIWQRAKLFWLYQDYLEMFQERFLERQILRWGAGRHDKILTVSDWSRQELAAFTTVPMVVVGEGLSHAGLFCPRPVSTNNSPKKILFLGDMRPRKGLWDFLAAMEMVYRHIPDIKLLIVSKEDCQIETGLPYQYIYRPSRAELGELYATCDLFVSASWWESFGLPPLEAMACGAPVVLTDSRGVREYAQTGENCLMVPPREIESLAQAMEEVLTNPALAAKLRQQGPPTAARFSWEAAVDRFERTIRDD